MDEEALRHILNSEYKDYSEEEKIIYLLEKYDYLAKCKFNGNDELLRIQKLNEIEQELQTFDIQKILKLISE